MDIQQLLSSLTPDIYHNLKRAVELDTSLPAWARRSNPIVRRQLGIYWKTLPLELSQWLKVLGGEMLLVVVAACSSRRGGAFPTNRSHSTWKSVSRRSGSR